MPGLLFFIRTRRKTSSFMARIKGVLQIKAVFIKLVPVVKTYRRAVGMLSLRSEAKVSL
jgi:hypothetical protein